jgi:hypothetical protein
VERAIIRFITDGRCSNLHVTFGCAANALVVGQLQLPGPACASTVAPAVAAPCCAMSCARLSSAVNHHDRHGIQRLDSWLLASITSHQTGPDQIRSDRTASRAPPTRHDLDTTHFAVPITHQFSGIMSNIAATLKQQKEEFVSGLTGGSVSEINAVTSVATVRARTHDC